MVLTRGSMGGTISLNSNFSTTTLSKETTTEVAAASYKVKIENTEETEPRIASMETENIRIEQDTTINFSVNKLPIANAGEDLESKVGQYVILDGTQSEAGDGSELHYRWYADTTNPAEVGIVYILAEAPAGFTEEGTYKFSLVVYDGIAYSEADEVVVEVGSRGESKFEDPMLEIEVRFCLGAPTEELTEEKLDSLYTFTLQGFGEVSSLYGLENCKNLTWLIAPSNNITDLTPLSGLTKLENLALDQTHILSDISPLANLTNLTELNLESNNISDISALRNMTKMYSLHLIGNPIEDFSALEDMTELNDLWIGQYGSNIYPCTGTDVISNFTKLDILWITDCDVFDISFISTLSVLRYLRLSYCNVENISAISNCTQLMRLYLDGNNITDITPLEELTNIYLLDLKYNEITNIEPLVNNSSLGQGAAVSLIGNPLDEISINQYIPELQNRGVTVFY
ncbi:MAG: leucine-rich repeat domain-containing protein, partial [Ignavibacteria bacterium]|jgi:Leucine-rich repeat (LRR) protein